MPYRKCNLIYGLVDPGTKLVRYIGKSTTGMLRPRCHRRQTILDKTHCANWLKNLKSRGLEYEIVILEEAEDPGLLADLERWWIAYGRTSGWPLTNLTDGGDGTVNPSDATREKLSKATKARWQDPAWREKVTIAIRSAHNTPEAVVRKREVWAERDMASWKSAVSSEKARANHRKAMNTPETKSRLRQQILDQWSDPSNRAAFTKGRRKRVTGDANPAKRPEVRAKLSARMREVWAERRRRGQVR